MANAIAAARDASEMLATRRSPLPDSLVAPGPDAEESARLLEIALRVPDHGRLAPWRLIRIAGASKTRWVERLMELVEKREDAAKTRVSTRKLASAPLAVVVVSKATPGHKVPEWEQWLSAGAVCMNLVNGAHALGYGAQWLTGWHAYDADATALLGLADGEKVAGVILIGSVAEPAGPRPRVSVAEAVTDLDL
ncbi:nitroreductase [Rhizorhabdus sp.]|jgi:nitroreductase|uniref:nitroreductase family protein n=1 Tax=Rhizorhabdus sp. TaxID=1968843 RepID=UPI001B6B80FD|nr:nitroreductase [Rhizorhabdus sp.]MBP8233208.1 nitroreductase [Rhizorhabdus sp.]